MLRDLSVLALAGSVLFSSTAVAAAAAHQGALAPGKPASVQKAQAYTDKAYLLWLLGAGVVIGGVALVSSGDSHGSVTITTPCAPDGTCPPTTTTTTTTTTTSTTTTTTTH